MVQAGRSNIESFTIKNEVRYSNEGDCVVIHNLYVHPEFRNNGVARKLVTIAIREIKSKYPNLPIMVKATPHGKGGLNEQQLKEFYNTFKDITIW